MVRIWKHISNTFYKWFSHTKREFQSVILSQDEYHKPIKCTVYTIMPNFSQLQGLTKGNKVKPLTHMVLFHPVSLGEPWHSSHTTGTQRCEQDTPSL